MLYTKIQPQSFFLVFLPYMGMAAILFNDAEPIEQSALRQKAPCEIWWKLVK